jgi:ABC-2 type transport system ATP-binding protein
VKLEMQSWWNKKVEDLSKGMSQKLQFVITVLHEPKLIILDEPFSGLDPVNANLIRDEIHRLAAEGATIIFSTHRMEQVEEICDHILLINKGRKVLDGTVKEVKQRYKENLFLLEFDKPWEAQPSPTLFETIRHLSQSLVVRIQPGHSPNELLQHFLNEKAPLTGFRELLPSLNDIFIKLVEGTPVSRQFEKKAIH